MLELKFKDPVRHQFLPGQTIKMVIRHHNDNCHYNDDQWIVILNEFDLVNGKITPRPGDFCMIPVVDNK